MFTVIFGFGLINAAMLWFRATDFHLEPVPAPRAERRPDGTMAFVKSPAPYSPVLANAFGIAVLAAFGLGLLLTGGVTLTGIAYGLIVTGLAQAIASGDVKRMAKSPDVYDALIAIGVVLLLFQQSDNF